MRVLMSLARPGMALIMVMATADAPAQTYRCRSGNSSYLSSTPCTTGAGQKIGVIGPLDSRQPTARSSYTSPIGKAPDHLVYLGAE